MIMNSLHTATYVCLTTTLIHTGISQNIRETLLLNFVQTFTTPQRVKPLALDSLYFVIIHHNLDKMLIFQILWFIM